LNTVYQLKILLLTEKLLIIQKELKNLKNIAHFFSCESNNRSSCQTFKNLYEEIELNHQDVKRIINSVNNIKNKKFQEPLFHLIEDNCFSQTIKKLLMSVSLLSDKLFQMKKENFPDYNPSPLIGKRYSSKGFVDYLNRDYNELISLFNKQSWINSSKSSNITKQVLFHWDYSDMYYVKQSYKSDDEKEERLKHVKLAYWNHDIPVLVPAITHEVGHLLIKKNKIFSDYINERTLMLKETYIQQILNKYGTKTLIEEFAADLFALSLHKESYIFTLFYVVFGSEFCDTFVKDKTMILPELNFSQKRDYSIVRIATLIDIYLSVHWPFGQKHEIFINHINEIKKTIQYFYPIWETQNISKNSLPNIFSEYWTYQGNFDNLVMVVQDVKNILLHGNIGIASDDHIKQVCNYLLSISSHVETNCETSNIFHIKKDTHTLWLDRIKNTSTIHHKKFFREKLMKTYRIEFLSPYELNFNKLHMTMGEPENDSRTQKDKGYFDGAINFLNNQMENNPFYESNPLDFTCSSLGNYHIVSLKKKASNINIDEIIKYNDSNNDTENGYHYFTKKHSLLEINIGNNEINNTTYLNGIGFIIQIQLFINNNEELSKLLEQIENNFQNYYGNYRLFKSLGPCEVVMILNNISLEDVFKIKALFASKINASRRTTSSIFFDNFSNDIVSTREYSLSSRIRLAAAYNDTSKRKLILSHLKAIKNRIFHISEIPGEHDLKILWENGTSLKDLDKFYHHVKRSNVVTDIQSNFSLQLSLE